MCLTKGLIDYLLTKKFSMKIREYIMRPMKQLIPAETRIPGTNDKQSYGTLQYKWQQE